MIISKNKILISGGSYNPLHLSHEMIAYKLSEHFDEVWLMPCYESLWGKHNVDSIHRLNMCKLVSDQYENIKTCDWEIVNKMTGGTYVIIEQLKKDFPDYDFHFLIGMDNANNIHKFKNYEKLLESTKFVVVPRTGIESTTDWYLKSHHKFFDITVDGISSSEFRTIFKNDKESAKKYLNPKVYEYIIEQGLYE